MGIKFSELNTKIRQLQAEQPWDARTKEYKRIDRELKTQQEIGKQLVLDKASKKLNKLGFNFIKDRKFMSHIYADGFTVYLKATYSTYSSEDSNYEGYWHLVLNPHSPYGPNLVSMNTENLDSEIIIVLKKAHEDWRKANATRKINNNNSSVFYMLVKHEVSSKSYHFDAETGGAPWTGSDLEMTHEGADNSWQNKSSLKMAFYGREIEARVDLSVSFKHPREAKAFWDDYKKLVEKHTRYIRKKENSR